MRLMILAFLALAAPAAAQPLPPKTVSPVTVTAPAPVAATVEVGGDEQSGGRDFVAIWPGTAYQTGAEGKVTLSCWVDIHGLAERCSVVSERPERKGFGKAALELRPTFLLTPAKGPDGQPVNATMSINIAFKAPRKELVGTEGTGAAVRSIHDTENMIHALRAITGNPLAMRKVTMVDDPVWVAAAGFEDLARAYPAKGGGVQGYAAAHCLIERSGAAAGTLSHCQIIKESPYDRDFGKAALSLAPKFRLAPSVLARAPHGAPLWVDVPIRMPPPSDDRTVMAPVWTLAMDPRAIPRVFPPQAADAGVTTGRGMARCTVAADGALAACVPEPGEPDGLGFSEAAVKLASTLKMNLWSADGAPVQGGVVHIPIRLNLKGAN